MNTASPTQPSRSDLLYPLLLGLAALAIRLWHLDFESIWLDEAMTAYHSSLPALTHWTSPVVNKPPLYYHLTDLVWSPGDGAFILRLPSAIFGVLSVILAWFFGKTIGGRRTAFLCALFVLISAVNIKYSQEARHYMMLTLGFEIVALALLQLVRNASAPRPALSSILWLGAGILLMIHAHPIAIHYVAAAGISYLVALACSRRLTLTDIAYPLAACTLAGLTVLPWILVMPTSFEWLEQVSFMVAVSDFGKLSGAGGITMLLALAGLILHARQQSRSEGTLLLGLLILPPLMIWLTGLIKPVFMLRTILPVHFVAAAGLAILIDRIRGRRLAFMAVALLGGLMLYQTFKYYSTPRKEDWQSLTRQWQELAQPGDIMIFHRPDNLYPVLFYLDQRMPSSYSLRQGEDGTQRLIALDIAWPGRGGAAATPDAPKLAATGSAWLAKRGGSTPPAIAAPIAYLENATDATYSVNKAWRYKNTWLVQLRQTSERPSVEELQAQVGKVSFKQVGLSD